MTNKTPTELEPGTKAYVSVQDLLTNNLGKRHAVTQSVSRRIQSRRLVKKLILARNEAGLSQTALAKKLKCSQSRISKIENGTDDQIRMADLRAYASALQTGMLLSLGEPKQNAVESIKHHAMQIKHHLDQLAALARKDEQISSGVQDFFGETLFNMLKIIEDSAQKLPPVEEPEDNIFIYREKETGQSLIEPCGA